MEGGYGWIVVLATFVINAIVQGLIASSGILLNVLLDQFKHDGKAKIGWIPSLLGGLLLATGPLSSYLVERYSCRFVTMIGALVATCGCFISYFAKSVTQLILTYGIITGFGFGLMYLPQTIIVAEWFREKRSTATGVGLSGSGFGAFVIPPISQYILREYGWHSYFLAAAVAVLFCVFFGLLLVANPDLQVEKRNPASSRPVQFISWSLLKDTSFVMFCVSTGLFSGTYRVPFSFLPDYSVRQLQTSKSQAAYLLSYLGFASFLGRLLGGFVGDSFRHRRFLIILVFIMVSGLSVVGMGLSDNYMELALCSFGYGAASGGRVALNAIILADLFGLAALSQTFGLVCLVQGVSIFFGTPIAG
ncbi:hypothetical protein RvY_04907-3 [Ramazzottius varieornatus]|nr:hypothetical protein RvY_04907-3 [Ramazzottius varieornatus]